MRERQLFDYSDSKISSGNLNGKYKKSWVEGSFIFEGNAGKQIKPPQTKSYLGLSFESRRVKLMMGIIFLGLFLVFLRVFYLQIINGGYYRELAEGNRVRLRPIPAERGIIYDCFGHELVQNVPNFSLAIVPQDLPRKEEEREALILKVSEIGGVDSQVIRDLIKKYKNYSYESLIIKENLDYDTALKLYIQNSDLPGIQIEKGTKRYYLNSADDPDANLLSLSHLLGYLGKLNDEELARLKNSGYLLTDNLGKTGLEKIYENELRGKYGRKKIEVNAAGKEMNVLAEEAPVPGKNVYLTLDKEAQAEMEKLIKQRLKYLNKTRAVAIAMNPQNGGILAMVSWPSFNNNDFSGGIDQATYDGYNSDQNRPLFNRAIGGTYPSGSTAKMIVAAAALQEKLVNINTTFLSVGGLEVGGHLFKDWKAGGHGVTNVTKALAWSVNTYFYYIGGGYKNFVGLGVDKIYKYMTAFYLGQKTGIDLPGENSGFVPTKDWKERNRGERWYVGDTYNLSIGQGNLLVTPLQVAVWTSAIANGGKVIEPHLLNKNIDPTTKKEVVKKPVILNENMVSEENILIVQQGMRQCVTEGSCQLLKTLPFLAAGKTGTAQWNSTKPDHAWFASFAPYYNPQIVVVVLVEEGEEGSTAAMPIARDFLAWWGKKYLK